MASQVEIKQNELVGRFFRPDKREFVVTSNDTKHVQATPLDCQTGLTSMQFSVRYVLECGHYAKSTTPKSEWGKPIKATNHE